jgi:hypothetical protein
MSLMRVDGRRLTNRRPRRNHCTSSSVDRCSFPGRKARRQAPSAEPHRTATSRVPGNASGTVHSGVVARTTREAGERGMIACQHVLSGFAEA